jgi:tetratricopeptide (TPR) repeat protein
MVLITFLAIPAILLADDDETLPPPRPAPVPAQAPASSGLPLPPSLPPRVFNLPPVPEAPDPAPDLAALRHEAERLRSEGAALASERQKINAELPADSAEIAHLRKRLNELVATLAARQPHRPAPAGTPPVISHQGGTPHTETAAGTPMPPADVSPGDPMLAARALFRAGDHAAALETYRQIDLDALTRDERTLVQYMSACCLRKLGRLDEAAALYREVASAREDEVLTDCALWHLSAINWRRDMEKQLEALRDRRQVH